jgi:F420-dependent oxidoreductase-like protein
MRLGMQLDYSAGFKEAVADLQRLESAGLDTVFAAELYSYDSISQLGYIAAKTETVKIATGIVNIYSRTPALLAMTAAGLDYISDGRFILGLGASGPQVVEGFHGVPYDAPIGRTREVIEICRKVWRREPLTYDGKYYQLPLPAEQGTGLGKPLKLINHPLRADIPVMLAAMGPKNVALAAELCEAWEPIFFHTGKAMDVFGPSLEKGRAKRSADLAPLEIYVDAPAYVGTDEGKAVEEVKHRLALYVGGMGAKGKNFYHDLATRYGYGDEADKIQDLYLSGKKVEAAAEVPEEFARSISLIGSESDVAEQLAAFERAGVSTILVSPVGDANRDADARLRLVEQITELKG